MGLYSHLPASLQAALLVQQEHAGAACVTARFLSAVAYGYNGSEKNEAKSVLRTITRGIDEAAAKSTQIQSF